MSDKPTKVLLVEDNLQYAHLIRAMLSGGGDTEFELTHVERLSDALKHLSKEGWDVVLLDLLLPDSHGLDTIVKVQAQALSVPIVVLTGLDDEALAIKAMQEGAQDYLVKGQVDGNLLKRSIRYAIERKRAEDVFKTLAISSPVGIYIVQDRAFQFVSPQFQELVGYSEDELLGTDSLTLVHPEDREMVRETAIKMLKEGHISPYEYRYISKSGQIKWVLETVASIQHRGKRATLGNFLDITERKQAEEELRRTEEQFQALVEESPLGVAMITKDGHYRYLNPKFVEMFGYTLEDIPTRQDWFARAYPDPEYRKQVISAWKTDQRIMAEGGEISHRIFTVTGKGGSEKVIQFRSVALPTGDYLILHEDITERKQMEEELRLRAQILDSATDSILVHDADDNFIYVNEAACRTHSYSREEFLKMKITELVAPERVGGLASDRQVLQEKGYLAIESAHRRKDGSIMPVEVHARTLESNGRKLFLTVARDITERKRMEEERRELDRMKSEFIANVSHELRTPLHSIRGFARLMLQDKVPQPEVQKEFLSIIDKQSENLEKLIDNLLDASRLESGRFKIQKYRLLIRDIIRETIESFYAIASEKGITINANIPEVLPEIEADGKRLKQVLNNLLSNAIKFSNGGSCVTVTGEAKDGELMVRVTDQGVGIPEEVRQHLFERFYRAKDTAKVGGTGLGLYISKQIIEAHGGRVWVESKVGEGSTFSFTLPLIKTSGDANE